MITTDKVLITEARSCAEYVRQGLEATCTHFSIAGAMRRGEVEHFTTQQGTWGIMLDFVVVPEIFDYVDPESGEFVTKDLLVDAIEGIDEQGQAKLLPSFPHLEHQVHVLGFPFGLARLWTATQETFGSVLLYRSGPREHTDMLLRLARQRHGYWLPHAGVCDGTRTVGTTEEEIYSALGMTAIDPVFRGNYTSVERASGLRPKSH